MNDIERVTQAELIQITIGQVDAIGTHISIYLTIVTAYLVVSYLAGRKLSGPQVAVATSIYLIAYIFESLILAALFRAATIAMQSYSERFTVVSPPVFEGIAGASYIGIAIIIVVLLSSLWFMWSVRQPEKENCE